MERFQGLFGIALILGIAFLASNNRRRINYRTVFSGLSLQLLIAVLVLKIPPVTRFFQSMGHGMQKIEEFARKGASFVYNGIAVQQFDGTIANYMRRAASSSPSTSPLPSSWSACSWPSSTISV
jgi:CNT family concentrative nucleoside transporter